MVLTFQITSLSMLKASYACPLPRLFSPSLSENMTYPKYLDSVTHWVQLGDYHYTGQAIFSGNSGSGSGPTVQTKVLVFCPAFVRSL